MLIDYLTDIADLWHVIYCAVLGAVLLETSATREEAGDIADAAYGGTNTASHLEDQVISKYLYVFE